MEKNLPAEQIGSALRIRGFKVEKEEDGILYFDQGTYNSRTGKAEYIVKKLPFILDKMEHLHKATADSPIF